MWKVKLKLVKVRRLQKTLFSKPGASLYLIDAGILESKLHTVAVCKECHGILKILANEKERQGLGIKWIFQCCNEYCPSHNHKNAFSISSMSDRAYDGNRLSVLTFRKRIFCSFKIL